MIIQFLKGVRISLIATTCFSKYLEENMKLNCPVLYTAVNNDLPNVRMEQCTDGTTKGSGVSLPDDTPHCSVSKSPVCEFHYVPILETLKTIFSSLMSGQAVSRKEMLGACCTVLQMAGCCKIVL